ncbi:Crinkler effector protein 108 [Pelomyxa schiedti]|nr:Crinkler effector protein 108 [Pelomyxa schiedti]
MVEDERFNTRIDTVLVHVESDPVSRVEFVRLAKLHIPGDPTLQRRFETAFDASVTARLIAGQETVAAAAKKEAAVLLQLLEDREAHRIVASKFVGLASREIIEMGRVNDIIGFNLELLHRFSQWFKANRDLNQVRHLTSEGQVIQLVYELKYVPPKKFCTGTGSTWASQEPEGIMETLGLHLLDHFRNFMAACSQKEFHPLFLALTGPGTGKSRLLQEFPHLSVKAISLHPEEGELHRRLTNAMIFNISFENGTDFGSLPQDTSNILSAISARMLIQLGIRSTLFHAYPTPNDVFTCMAKTSGQKLRDMTVFLMVDSITRLPLTNLDTTSPFSTPVQQCLASVAGLVNNTEGPLVIACCSGTLLVPLNCFLQSTPQRRVHLSPPPLSHAENLIPFPASINPNDQIQMVADMGGHGRALEALADACSVGITNPRSIVSNTVTQLSIRYPNIVADLPFIHVLKFIVMQRISPARNIYSTAFRDTMIPGTTIRVDTVISAGLITERNGLLVNAPAWAWVNATRSNDRVIQEVCECDWPHLSSFCEGHTTAPAWTNWERFNVMFYCLRSRMFHGEWVPLVTLFDGVTFSTTPPLPETLEVYVTLLEPDVSLHQQTTGTSRSNSLPGNFLKSFVLNATSADGGDAFGEVYVRDAETKHSRVVKVVHLYKKGQANLNATQYRSEYNKQAGPGDIFILFTTGVVPWNLNQEIPNGCGYVDCTTLNKYYWGFHRRFISS